MLLDGEIGVGDLLEYAMGKGRDKRKRAKEKKTSTVSDTNGNGQVQKESGAAKTQRKTAQNAERREHRARDEGHQPCIIRHELFIHGAVRWAWRRRGGEASGR